MRLIQTSPYRLESMKYFPYRTQPGDVPYKLFKVPKLSYLFEAAPAIAEQQKKTLWDSELLQNIFEYYCVEVKAAPVRLANFYNYDDPKNTKLSFRNF